VAISDGRYIAVTTFRRSGEAVSTPIRVVPVSDGRIGFWIATGSARTERLRHDPRVRVQPCDVRGRPRPGAPEVGGTAEMVRSGRLFDEVRARVREKYGLLAGISRLVGRSPGRRQHGDTVVLVRLDE
jgi:uncharacterized protein